MTEKVLQLPPGVLTWQIDDFRKAITATTIDTQRLRSILYFFLNEENITPEICLAWTLHEAERLGVENSVIRPLLEAAITKNELLIRIEDESEERAQTTIERYIKREWGRYIGLVSSGKLTPEEVIAVIHRSLAAMSNNLEREDIQEYLVQEKLIRENS